eukprot:Plantae.Rhodophyta-Purpureofilum_apyrenoidigerum.ctg5096.p1 GENE.Plantae.Rhodophyta-Purpureofilum_apyrenoidigerum.ctg5096~~Plantae.Rhodophyta-Purpureofilum_apyrenoidigerum.ctg5096.p1  ORF type:complete len:188 (-),score=47.01 Plantae.Rhodophyta-Purpureofilum_apyrenoidigerum.ctg5096:249-812(-)
MGAQYMDAIAVVLISVVTSLLTEVVSWLFVYRTSDFKSNKRKLDELSKRREKEDAITVSLDKRKLHDKKLQRINEDIRKTSTTLNGQKFKLNIVISIFYMIVYRVVSKYFYGKPVATLPFDPITYVRGMTHRGIEGEDYSQCSFAFIYALCTWSIRGSIQKAFGFQLPRSATEALKAEKESNPWGMK